MIKTPVKVINGAKPWCDLVNDERFLASYLSNDDAVEIARILNAHDALVEALTMIDMLDGGECGEIARKALSAAKGGAP